MSQNQHTLSRIALAKAIKTPDIGDTVSDSWQKSIIFNQPFVLELQKKARYPLYTKKSRPEKGPEQKSHRKSTSIDKKSIVSSKPSSVKLVEKMSELNIKRSGQQKSCIPSDSEEEEEDEEDESEDEDSDGTELFQAVNTQKRPTSLPAVMTRPSPTSSSGNSSRDDISSPSRDSLSSHTLPLTDDDEENASLHHIRSNSGVSPPLTTTTTDESQYYRIQQQQKMSAMDYQRLQQQQLLYQYQYQFALQQQQMYMLSQQSPSGYFPSTASHVSSTNQDNKNHRRHSTSNTSQHRGGKPPIKLSNTDLRRKAEMLKHQAESNYRNQQYLQMQQLATPSVIKSNTRRPTYNV